MQQGLMQARSDESTMCAMSVVITAPTRLLAARILAKSMTRG
jgi:hypothetical protein